MKLPMNVVILTLAALSGPTAYCGSYIHDFGTNPADLNYGGNGGTSMGGGIERGGWGGVPLTPGRNGDSEGGDRRAREEDEARSRRLNSQGGEEISDEPSPERLKAIADQKKADEEARAHFRELSASTQPHILKWESEKRGFGECFEIDQASGGAKFRLAVQVPACEQGIQTEVHWDKELHGCLKADVATRGLKYAEWMGANACPAISESYEWRQSSCVKKSLYESGGSLTEDVSDIDCAPEKARCLKASNSWALVDYATNGKAYSSSSAGQLVCGEKGIFQLNEVINRAPDSQAREVLQRIVVKRTLLDRAAGLEEALGGDTKSAR